MMVSMKKLCDQNGPCKESPCLCRFALGSALRDVGKHAFELAQDGKVSMELVALLGAVSAAVIAGRESDYRSVFDSQMGKEALDKARLIEPEAIKKLDERINEIVAAAHSQAKQNAVDAASQAMRQALDTDPVPEFPGKGDTSVN